MKTFLHRLLFISTLGLNLFIQFWVFIFCVILSESPDYGIPYVILGALVGTFINYCVYKACEWVIRPLKGVE